MKGRQIPYSHEELAWIEERREWSRPMLHSVFVMLFDRPDVSVEALKALCTRKGWMTGRTGCFAKGSTPANKGKPCPPGQGGRHPNAQRTQFKPGGRTGEAARKYQPIGAERFSKEGYRERKIHDGLPLQSRWRSVHLIEWEAVNGPIPEGHFLKCLDGDRQNTDPSNWELMPRAMLPALNGGPNKTRLAYADASPEVRPTLIAIARVEHAARQLRRKEPVDA
jgi:hypothetical protein